MWSHPPEANVPPSGEKATEKTMAVWPFKVRIRLPPAPPKTSPEMSQSLIVLSALAEASTLPSGEKARALIAAECPLKALCPLAFATSQSLTL